MHYIIKKVSGSHYESTSFIIVTNHRHTTYRMSHIKSVHGYFTYSLAGGYVIAGYVSTSCFLLSLLAGKRALEVLAGTIIITS